MYRRYSFAYPALSACPCCGGTLHKLGEDVTVWWTEIAIALLSDDHASEDENDNPLVLAVPHRRHRDVIAPEGPSRTQVLPIRSDTRVKLVTAIARGRQWLSSKAEQKRRRTAHGRPHNLWC
jgi:hypothetical protein